MPSFVQVAATSLRAVARFATAGEEALQPPSRRSERVLATLAHRGFNVAVVISGALLLGLLAFDSQDQWLAWAKLVLGAAMCAEGLLLATDWRGARRLAIWRLLRGRIATHTRPGLRVRLALRFVSPAVQLLGVVWFAAGLLTAVLGLQRLA